MLISHRHQNRPTRLAQDDQFINRRLLKEETEHSEHLTAIKETGYNFLKPPGVRKTMAILAQEARERSSLHCEGVSFAGGYDRSFGQSYEQSLSHSIPSRLPDASLNHSMLLDDRRSSFASWQTFDESDSAVPPTRTDLPVLPRSPAIDFSRMRERERDRSDQSIYHDSIYYDSIYIRQDSSFR